ncbi:hypothetical protein [Soonwooa purpurea]
MKLKLFLICLIFSNSIFGQLNSDKFKLLENLNKLNYAESENIGYAGTLGKTRIEFDSIKSKFNNNDLIYISKNLSAPLKLYSSIELVHRNDNRIFDIYKFYKTNKYEIEYHSGDTNIGMKRISDLIFEEFENLLNKKKIVEKTKSDLENGYVNEVYKKNSEDFVKYGTEYLDKVITKKFYSIYSKIQKLETK